MLPMDTQPLTRWHTVLNPMGKAILCGKKELYIRANRALLEIGIMVLLFG